MCLKGKKRGQVKSNRNLNGKKSQLWKGVNVGINFQEARKHETQKTFKVS